MSNIFFSQLHKTAGSAWASGKTAMVTITIAFLLNSPVAFASESKLVSLTNKINTLSNTLQDERTEITSLERSIWSLDANILETRKELRKERDNRRADLHEAKRDLKRQTFEIERLQKAVELVDQEIELTQRDSQRSQEYFNSLNALKRQLESDSYNKKIASNDAKITQLERERKPLIEKVKIAQQKFELLRANLSEQRIIESDSEFDNNPRLKALLNKREQQASNLIRLRKAVTQSQAQLEALSEEKKSLAKTIAQQKRSEKMTRVSAKAPETPSETAPENSNSAYVFAISGEYVSDIEKTLNLKNWVESYGAKYIEANWNGMDLSQANGEPNNTALFQAQFAKQLAAIPKTSKIILIGHGRGGGAAIEAATHTAFKLNRTIEFLAVLDPIGENNLRANIVYDTKLGCSKPSLKDQVTNVEYLACIRDSKPREITANVKHFYNRWQKDGKGPADYLRRIKAIDNAGQDIDVPTATGRFVTNTAMISDQRRVFFEGDENAHRLLLSEEAKLLPKLLVKHLR